MATIDGSGSAVLKQPQPPLLTRLSRGAIVYTLTALLRPVLWYTEWSANKLPHRPTLVKTYGCRPSLPIRIFFPEQYDRPLAQTLPTVFMIHGGGFTVGSPHDDDRINSSFVKMHNALVIELNYRKAPWNPFPTAPHDLEALILAAYEDPSLPIDKSRIAIGGFSAGGNLTLAVSQLPSIREKVKPSAAILLYPALDFTVPLGAKEKSRYYKPSLGSGQRSASNDFLSLFAPLFDWSYIPAGQDLRDPLISPYFAPREILPPHIFVIGAELDQLAHEDWRFASKLAGRPIPTLQDKVGQERPSEKGDAFILDDERFAFEHVEKDGKRSVRWLLVPDQIHGFDVTPIRVHGSEDAFKDAQVKAEAYQKLVGKWLFSRVWKQ